MKRILCVLIAILMMLSLTVPAFAADEVKAISTNEDLVKLLILGGKGKIENDIRLSTREILELIKRTEEEINPKAEIDLNGNTLIIEALEDPLTLENVVWNFKNGTLETREDFYYKNNVKFSDAILTLDKVQSPSLNIFSDDSNITLFLTSGSFVTATSNKPFSFCYHTSLCYLARNDKNKDMLIDLDGGIINLASFINVTFKDGYVDLDSVIPQKSNTKFLGWNDCRAEWTTEFTITFDPGEGTCDTQTLKTLDNSKLERLPIASKDGYCFVGWFEEGSNQKVTVDTVFEKDTTLHAKLIAKEEQIKNIEKPMKDLGFGEADVQKVISLFSSNKVAGSAIVSEPVWGVVIAALVVGAFAGGTAFGSKRNKKD